MGFVTLEDVQGNIELVVFPRTWDKYWEAFEVDSVVLVDGKVDAQGGDPKVLVDKVTTDLKSFTSAEPPAPRQRPAVQSARRTEPPTGQQQCSKTPGSARLSNPAPRRKHRPPEQDWADLPEPPDNGGPV